MLPLPAIKLGAQIVCGIGTTKIVNDIIRHHVVILSTADTIKVWMGSLVISGIVMEQSSNYIDRVTTEVTDYLAKKKTEDLQVEE